MKKKIKHYRSIFISDIHLGSGGCQASAADSFLKSHSCDNLYLVGDIIDGWKLRKRVYWPQEHSHVIRQIINKQRHGSKVVYITGNHDEFLREWLDIQVDFESIEICNSCDHQGLDGKKYLVVHGDLFDGVHRMAKWISYLGDWSYSALLVLNRYYNVMRHKFGFGYWSLSAYLKRNVKGAIDFIFEFETTLSKYCKSKGYDGVICGHIHTAVIKEVDGVVYMNSGDWVESCTALVENVDGTWEIVHWTKRE
jgi:UDP-2,3-diacylglucosamine pyrophosphatase LpxH